MSAWMPWWAVFVPAVRPLTSFVLMLALGFVQRRSSGRWPTGPEWRAAASEGLPSPWSVLAALVRGLRRRR